MNADKPDSLEAVIRDAGEGWIVDWFEPPSAAVKYLQDLLGRANERICERFGSGEEPITDAHIVREYRRSPHKIHAFIQALGATRSPDMLVMVWRILHGVQISSVNLNYRFENEFHLKVILGSREDSFEEYESNDIDDASLLRHFGIMKMSDRPIFDGFYANYS
jgi:plasmid stabilization system protein ParE